MFKVEIKKDNKLTNYAEFKTQEECESWIDDNHDYFPKDYRSYIVDIAQEKQTKLASIEALAYLQATDYLIIKQIEIGVPCPEEIITLRAAARLKVL